MQNWELFAKTLIELIGFRDFRVEVDEERRRVAVFVYDNLSLFKENVPALVESLNHLAQLIARKHNQAAFFFDLNNYRQEREGLITELARAAAKKALATKTSISLPAMNSYERRLVHLALAIHPEVTTESVGKGKDRYVIIKPIDEGQPSSAASPASSGSYNAGSVTT